MMIKDVMKRLIFLPRQTKYTLISSDFATRTCYPASMTIQESYRLFTVCTTKLSLVNDFKELKIWNPIEPKVAIIVVCI